MSNNISVSFMGSRGGGSLIFIQLAHLLYGEGLLDSLVVSSRNDELSNLPPNLKALQLEMPGKKLLLLTPFHKRKLVKGIVRFLEERNVDTVLIPMLHPWDNFLIKKLKGAGIRCVLIIHDYPPHPLSLFPTKRFTEMVVSRAWRVMVLSEYVRGNLGSFVSAYSMPFPSYSSVAILKSETFCFARQNSILFLGRNDRYKGIKIGLKAVEDISFDGKVIVAGSLGRKVRCSRKVASITRWLSRVELEYLISTCRVLVLPYSSATQSGLISIARYYCTPVVVTPVGGLVEQVRDYPLGFVSDGIDSDSIGRAIELALKVAEEKSESAEISTVSNLMAVLTDP